MFRSRKIDKKRKQQQLVSKKKKRNDDDDGGDDKSSSSDEEPPTVVNRHKTKKQQPKKKKKKSKTLKSFAIGSFDEEDDVEGGDITSSSSSHRKRKRGGLGFGGGGGSNSKASTTTMMVHDDDDMPPTTMMMDTDEADNNLMDMNSSRKPKASLYSKDSLAQLRQEQKSIPKSKDDENVSSRTKKHEESSKSSSSLRQATEPKSKSNDLSSDYIPLNSSNGQTTILSGDQALAFDEAAGNDDNDNDNDNNFAKSNTNTNTPKLQNQTQDHQEHDIPQESSDWEAEIARRAGVGSAPAAPFHSTTAGAAATNQPIPSLSKLRDQISSTRYHLEQQQNDLETSTMRRQAELAQTESDLKRHGEAVEASGVALQEYQQLRQNLVVWVGALRDLQAKIDPLRETAQDLLLEELRAAHEEWVTIPDDVASILRDANLLDRALGRQPTFPSVQDMECTVDEFGRDVPSKYLRQRTQRYTKRMKRDKRHWFLEEEQLNDYRERYHTLQGALRVALEELSEEYLSLPDLISEFSNWKSTHGEEYKQCYASLSLGDLASVLVQVKILESPWLSNLFQDDDEDLDLQEIEGLFSWVADFKEIESDLEDGEDGPAQRVLEKTLCPLLKALVDDAAGSYCFVSKSKSQLLSKCMARVTDLFHNKSHDALVQLQEAIQRTLENSFHTMCIPIAKRGDAVDESATSDEMVQYALTHAREEHVKLVQQLFVNIVRDWVPLMISSPDNSRFVKVLLDFCSNKFLFVLSSLNASEATDLFRPVWQELNTNLKDFLNDPEYMLQAAPIRAAAMAYQLN